MSRNSRGRGLPSCGIAVTRADLDVPEAERAAGPRTPTASLSNPAATPNGEANVEPERVASAATERDG